MCERPKEGGGSVNGSFYTEISIDFNINAKTPRR